jgi:hypothetical protein
VEPEEHQESEAAEAAVPSGGSRARGPRHRLSDDFLSALARDFAEHGAEAVRACRAKDPVSYCRVVTAALPKEVAVTVSELEKLDDAELDRRIAAALQALGAAGGQADPGRAAG